MKRDEFLRAGDDPGYQDFDAVQLAALSGADIAARHELFEDTEHAGGNGDASAPVTDAGAPTADEEPGPDR